MATNTKRLTDEEAYGLYLRAFSANPPRRTVEDAMRRVWREAWEASRAAALEEAAKACDAEVSEITKADDHAAIVASACTERIRAMVKSLEGWKDER